MNLLERFKNHSHGASQSRVTGRVSYATSPLLASKTPPWRSKFVVICIGVAFCALLGRAAYVQIINDDFYQKQGENRYTRTLTLPASRGRIVDRNGQILASSVPAPSIWAAPKDITADREAKTRLAQALNMSATELDKKLQENANFVWLRRQVDEPVAEKVKELKIKGIHQVQEYKRQYPEGEATAHLVGFTNMEDKGQEGTELAYQKSLSGKDGSRRVIKDRLGQIVEDLGESSDPLDGKEVDLSIDSKIQFFAYQRLRDAVKANKAPNKQVAERVTTSRVTYA